MITFSNLTDMWRHAMDACTSMGRVLESRNGGCRELIGQSLALADLDQNFVLDSGRRASPSYAAAELLWYLSGAPGIEMIRAYAPQYERFAEDDGIAYGAYGARWADHRQLQTVVDLLRSKPETRQAIISMWRATDLERALAGDRRDLPCTLTLQLLVRDGRLHMVATMRSNDAWLGLPYDVFCFTSLQRLLADELGLRYGRYVHNVGSLHVYDRDAAKPVGQDMPPDLGHGWTPTPAGRMSAQVAEALTAEATARLRDGVYDSDNRWNYLTYDLVVCCCRKFKGFVKPHSPIFNRAFELMEKKP